MGEHPPPKVVVCHDDEGRVFPVGVGVIGGYVVLGGPLSQVIKVRFLGVVDLSIKGFWFCVKGGNTDLELGGEKAVEAVPG
jgi:hypothetical protein